MAELKVTTEQFPLDIPELLKLRKEISKDTLVVPLQRGGAEWYRRYLSNLLPPHRVQELEIHSYSSNRRQQTLTVGLPNALENLSINSIVLMDDIVDSGLTMRVAGTVMQHFYPNIPTIGLTWFRRCNVNNAPPFKLISLYIIEKEWIVFPWEVEQNE